MLEVGVALSGSDVPAAKAEGRPMRRDAVRNQQLVIDAARDVLSEFGPDATMEVIAARAGVGVGTVYRHYPNKAALLEELVRLILAELVEIARDALANQKADGLHSFLTGLGGSFVRHLGYADKLAQYIDQDCSDLLRSLIADLLTQAQARKEFGPEVTFGDIMATIWAIRGVIEATIVVAPHAWERHLDIHLAGLRSDVRTELPSLSRSQVADVAGRRRSGQPVS